MSTVEREQLRENPGGLAIREARYLWADWVNEKQYWRDKTFAEMEEQFKNFIEGLLNIFAQVSAERPEFDPRKITFQRPRWLKDGKIIFELSYDGVAMHPHDHRWSQ